MTGQKRQLEKYRNNPKTVSFEKLVSLLKSYGFEVNNYSGGSHYSVSHPDYDVINVLEPNSIPMNKPHVLSVFVKRAIAWIDRVEVLEEEKGQQRKTVKVMSSIKTTNQYPFAVAPYEDDDFVGYRAFLIDIPAIESLGTTPEEAVADLEDVRKEWFAFAQAKGIHIPNPDTAFSQRADYNGRVTLRMPRSLHQKVAQKAALEGVSLNSYLNSAIERAVVS